MPLSSGTDCIEATTSHKLFENLLMTYYVPMEIWYTRTVIDKVSLQPVNIDKLLTNYRHIAFRMQTCRKNLQ